ncbi:diguanylate cyclase [Dialister sp.]|uniref:sensor domain-containing diguanylate cyclase n=1 Tax=Dialister sp. TaxID=1955814 RepID=UPI003F053900
MHTGNKITRYLSIPVIICGLFLTLLVDFILYQNDDRKGYELFSREAVSRINNVGDYVHQYETIADVLEGTIRRKNGNIADLQGPARYMEINPSVQAIDVLPAGGQEAAFSNVEGIESGTSLLEGPLKEAARKARETKKSVLSDSIPMKNGNMALTVLHPVYLESDKDSFWGYVLVAADQEYVFKKSNIIPIEGRPDQFSLFREEDGEKTVILQQGTVRENDPYASAIIGGSRWTLSLRPLRGWFNLQTLILATLSGIMATFFVSFLWRKNRTLKVIGATDSLTGVYNRKGGDEAVSRYMADNPYQKAMVIALDIDNFKLINDVYGHRAGDDALKQLTEDMRQTFGRETLITRNGGDEFVLYHPYHNMGDVILKMDHFTREPHIIEVDGKEVPFYSSLGCAEYPQQGNSYGKLCIRADFALYGAKLNGKAGWRKFDDSIGEVHHRAQFGFNLSDIAASMPGGMLVCKATKDQEILFANKAMIDLLECDDFEDFMQYTGGTFYTVLYPGEKEAMQAEFQRQLAEKDNTDSTDFISFRIVTKKGHVITVEDMGRKSENPFYGELFYIFMYDKAKRQARQKI